jgi:hypothetical protein
VTERLSQNAVHGTGNPHIHLLTNWTFEAPKTKGTKAKQEAAAKAAFIEFGAYVAGSGPSAGSTWSSSGTPTPPVPTS